MRITFPLAEDLWRFSLAAVLLAALGVSCSATRAAPPGLDSLARQLRPPQGYALVYVLRPEFMGKTVRFDVKVNGVWVGSTGGFRYVITYLRPGHYLFQSRAENLASLRLTVLSGRVYFIEQRPQMGVLGTQNELLLLTEDVGRLRLRHCTLSMAMPREVIAYLESGGRDGVAAVSGIAAQDQGGAGQRGTREAPPRTDAGDQALPVDGGDSRVPSEGSGESPHLVPEDPPSEDPPSEDPPSEVESY